MTQGKIELSMKHTRLLQQLPPPPPPEWNMASSSTTGLPSGDILLSYQTVLSHGTAYLYMVNNVVPSFEYVDEILKWGHSNEIF